MDKIHHVIMADIMEELMRAKTKHPTWPDDIIHAVAVLVEEAGETLQAAVNHHYAGESIDNVIYEAIQTGAMVFRLLENLKGYVR